MAIIFERETFFDSVRHSVFSGRLNQAQVDGLEGILVTFEGFYPEEDLRWLAYVLATATWETAYTVQPIEEYGKGEGKPYGETDPETGQAYYGRGLVQLTHRSNYARADLELDLTADRSCEWIAANALELDIATRVIFRGSIEGWFTGKKLIDYFSDTKDDPKNARQIVNGNDKDDEIAAIHYDFLDALKLSLAAYVPDDDTVLNEFDTYQIRVPAGTPVQFLRVMSSTTSFPITPKDATDAPDTPNADPIYVGRRRSRSKRWTN